MSRPAAKPHNLSQSGQNLVRIVIASYFLAVSLGLIPGTVAGPLTAPFLPEPYAGIAGKAAIFLTAYLVLVGAWLRISALLLATLLFWSSYIANAGTGNLEAFWRDLALIGALILTYTQTLPRAAARRSALRWTPRARRLAPAQPVAPRRVASVVHPRRTTGRPAAQSPAAQSPAAQSPAAQSTVQPAAVEPAMNASPAPVVRLASVRIDEPSGDNIFREETGVALAG